MTDLNHTLSFTEQYFSELQTVSFGNGLQIYLLPNRDTSTVSVQAWVKTGSIHEQEYLGSGLSHFLEHMLFQGTEAYPGNRIAEQVHAMGGATNAYTSFGRTVFYIDLPSRHCGEAVTMLSSMLRSANCPEEKFISEKEVIKRESAMIYDDPMRVLLTKLWSHSFVKHPIRHPIIGYPDKISRVTREIMLDYYRQRYCPDRCFFVITGNFEREKVIEKLEQQLGDWKMGCLDEPVLPFEPRQVCSRRFSYHFDDPLARVAMGFKLPEISHRDIPALNIMTALLGRNDSSRLVERLEIAEELAIGVSASNYTSPFCSIGGIYAVASPDKIDRVAEVITEELDKIAQCGVDEAEIEREIIQNSTAFLRNMRHNHEIAAVIGGSVMDYEAPDYATHYLTELAQVGKDDIQRVAQYYFGVHSATAIKLLPDAVAKKSDSPQAAGMSLGKSQPASRRKGEGGERVIYFPENRLPLVDIVICLPGGSFFEKNEQAGVGQLLSSTIYSGTANLNEVEFARQLDDNAIDLQVSAHINSFIIKLNCRVDRLKQAVELLQAMLTEPIFDEKVFAREQQNMLEMLESRQLNPQNAAMDRFIAELYHQHPYGRPSVGCSETVKQLTPAAVKEFYYRQCLTRSQAVFGICGDISESRAQDIITQLTSTLPWARNEADPEIIPPCFPEHETLTKVNVPREQAVVLYGVPGCRRSQTDEDLAVELLFTAETHQASALFKSVREQEGLAYYTGMTGSFGIHPGYMTFYAGTAPAKTEKVIELLRAEQQRLVKSGLTDAEFSAARENKFFAAAQSRQKPGTLLTASCLEEYYGNDFTLPWILADKYAALELDIVNRIIADFLKQPATIVIAGPETPQ